MERYNESQTIYDIRQYAEYKRAHTDWKDVSGDKYLEHVELLLQEIDGLQSENLDLDRNKECHHDGIWADGFEDGKTQGYREGESEGFLLGAREARDTLRRLHEDLTEAVTRLS